MLEPSNGAAPFDQRNGSVAGLRVWPSTGHDVDHTAADDVRREPRSCWLRPAVALLKSLPADRVTIMSVAVQCLRLGTPPATRMRACRHVVVRAS